MVDSELRLEAVSAVLSCSVKSLEYFRKTHPGAPDPPLLQPQDMADITLGVKSVQDFVPNTNPDWWKYALISAAAAVPLAPLSLPAAAVAAACGAVCAAAGMSSDASSNEVPTASTDSSEAKDSSAPTVPTAAKVPVPEVYVKEEDFFDPDWDTDFTNIKNRQAFKRGGETYRMPCGWARIALKVLGKYEDGDVWLEKGTDAWPVSFHGTSIQGAAGIIQTHYKAGSREKYGRGIYSTPKISIAEKYAQKFTSEKTKKEYEVILQNRINPKKREKHNNDDFWLVKLEKGTSTNREREIVQNSIRPYGLLIREI